MQYRIGDYCWIALGVACTAVCSMATV
jgi:hypothetical protein